MQAIVDVHFRNRDEDLLQNAPLLGALRDV